MAISEESRHKMYRRLEELMGHEEAATLMAHLPPVGWADVATKRDVDHLGEVVHRDIERLDARLDALGSRLDDLRADTRSWVDDLRSETMGRFDALGSRLDDLRADSRGWADDLRGETRGWVDDLRGETRSWVDDLRSETMGRFDALGARLEEVARNTLETRAGLRSLFLGLVALQLTGAGLVLAVAGLT